MGPDYLIDPSLLEKFISYCKSFLISEISVGSVCKMSDEIIASADSIWLDIKSDAPDSDCRKGCSWCCHQSVSVTWPEVLNIVNYLGQKLNPAQVKTLMKRSKDKADKIKKKINIKPSILLHNIPCLFLEDQICTIHSVRPLQCRGSFSEEESYCKSLLENPVKMQKAVEGGYIRGKFLIIPKLIYNSAQAAMSYAMKDFGMKGSSYELTLVMSILITKLFNGELDSLTENDLKSAVMSKYLKV